MTSKEDFIECKLFFYYFKISLLYKLQEIRAEMISVIQNACQTPVAPRKRLNTNANGRITII